MLDDGIAGNSSGDDASMSCGLANNSFASFVSDGAGSRSSAFGIGNDSPGNNSSAFGFNSLSRGNNSLAFGSWYDVNQDGSTGIDAFLFSLPDLDINGDGTPDSYSELTTAWGQSSVAIGPASRAVGDFSSVVGFQEYRQWPGQQRDGFHQYGQWPGQLSDGFHQHRKWLEQQRFWFHQCRTG